MARLLKLSIAFFLCFYVDPLWAQEKLWTGPGYPASEPKKIEIVVETQFNYHLFTPNQNQQKLRLLQKKYASLDTAEEALVSRFSAISSLNYPWWLETWQEKSKRLALAYYQQQGLDKDFWLDSWKKQFVGRDIKLKHKILYQDYVVFIYNVAEPSGREGYLDLPIVFSQENNQWLVSLDLRKNQLIRVSPWVTGRNTEIVEYE